MAKLREYADFEVQKWLSNEASSKNIFTIITFLGVNKNFKCTILNTHGHTPTPHLTPFVLHFSTGLIGGHLQ